MKDLKIDNSTAIHCPTEGLAKQVLSVLDKKGYKWRDGDSLEDVTCWDWDKKDTCYDVENHKDVCCYNKEWYEQEGYKIITAEEFIKQNTEMEKRKVEITLEQAKQMFEGDNENLKNIALSTFPELGKSKYPMSHNELQDLLNGENIYYINSDSEIQKSDAFNVCSSYSLNRNIILSEQRAEELSAFTQLLALRDEWNKRDKFVPDWNESSLKHIIHRSFGAVRTSVSASTQAFLSFKSSETRDLFYETFKDLIEEAKNLI